MEQGWPLESPAQQPWVSFPGACIRQCSAPETLADSCKAEGMFASVQMHGNGACFVDKKPAKIRVFVTSRFS